MTDPSAVTAGGDAPPTPRTLAKPQRQHRVGRLLAEHAVTSQAELFDLLAA